MTTPPKPRWPRTASLRIATAVSILAATIAPASALAATPDPERNHEWLVGLYLTNDDSPFCSGVLVAPRLVVTAAHCVSGTPGKSVRLSVVTYTGSRTAPVAKAVVHPQHAVLRDDGPRRTHVVADIAILHLAEPLQLPRYPALASERLRGAAYLYGTSPYRPEVELRVQHVTRRASAWFGHADQRTHVVAVSVNGTASCSGDSGGGLITWVGGKPVLTGVVSYGAAQCGDQVPTVFTKVSAYAAWLRDARRRLPRTTIDRITHRIAYLEVDIQAA